MDADAPKLLEIRGLRVRYGAVEAVRGVDLEVWPGEIVALLGANGAGKTTTLNAVMGVVRSTAERVAFDGRSMRGLAPERIVRSGIALVPEGRRVFGELSVADNLALGAAASVGRGDAHESHRRAFELFPALADRRHDLAGALSGGEQQQLAIARALMSNPRLLLLDEPTLGLAPKLAASIFALIGHLRTAHGTTVLFVEQNVGRALAVADRAYVMRTGAVVLADKASALAADDGVLRAYLGAQAARSALP